MLHSGAIQLFIINHSTETRDSSIWSIIARVHIHRTVIERSEKHNIIFHVR